MNGEYDDATVEVDRLAGRHRKPFDWRKPGPVLVVAAALIVLCVPLGLWMIGVQWLVGLLFGGRDYALNLLATVAVYVLFAVSVVRRPRTGGLWGTAAAVFGALLLWGAIGVAYHGLAQTAVGIRFATFPLVVLVVLMTLGSADTERLVTLMAWLLIANAVGSVGELIVGPQRLVAWGFQADKNVRYIDGTFRVPGLTEVNAELGLLAGAFLLGYVALWLSRSWRPTSWVWHAGAAASLLCLAVSTSRSGALLVAAGVLTVALANRTGSPAARRRARLIGLGVIVCVAGGFAALGATGAGSMVQRFGVWSALLHNGAAIVLGKGFGASGAATTSRVAAGHQIFVDNYFLSVALQFGLLALLGLVGFLVWLGIRLWRRAATRQAATLQLGLLIGLAASCVVLESWEYASCVSCLALFAAYAAKQPS